MNYIFPNLSPGYLFQEVDNLSLNARFYSTFDINDISKSFILFPQRIPREDFFKELIRLDVGKFREDFLMYKTFIKDRIREHYKNKKIENEEIINLINLALRYDLSDFLSTLIVKEDHFESRILIETARTHSCISRKINCDMKGFKLLLSEIIYGSASERLKLLMLNRFVVYSFRFQNDLVCKKIATDLLPLSLKLLNKVTDNDFYYDMIKSVTYRGLAMIHSLSKETKNQYIEKAESFARGLSPSYQVEEIISKENLYTCLQTLAKWYKYSKNENKALESYLEMTKLDPFDSTGYSELGLYYYENDEFKLAETMFRQASLLGAPGIGMNAYFLGKCFEKQNIIDKAIESFYSSIIYDPLAISPFLALISIYQKERNRTMSKMLISKLLKNSELANQLTDQERAEFVKEI